MNDVVPILFVGGTYGTYLEWCLTSLCRAEEVKSPFTAKGSSHRFIGNHLQDMQGWETFNQHRRKLLRSSTHPTFVRFHPKTYFHESLNKNLNNVFSSVKHALYLSPDSGLVLAAINNLMFKAYKNWWDHIFTVQLSPSLLYNNWPIDPDTPISAIPIWIQREFLSFHLMPFWLKQTGWTPEHQWQHPKCLQISMSDILYNFEDTILSIGKFCNLDFVQPIEKLLPYHRQNVTSQKYLDQDQLCNSIVDSTVSGIEFDWSDRLLTVISQGWIQWQLRNLGYEIECHGLDIFPTNSLQLKKLLYTQ